MSNEKFYLEKLKNNGFFRENDYSGSGITHYGKQGWSRTHFFKNLLTITDKYFINEEGKKYIKCTFGVVSIFKEKWDNGRFRAPVRNFKKAVDIWYNGEWLNSDKGEAFLKHIYTKLATEIKNEKEFTDIMEIMDSSYKHVVSEEEKEMIKEYNDYKSVFNNFSEDDLKTNFAFAIGQTMSSLASVYNRKYGRSINDIEQNEK